MSAENLPMHPNFHSAEKGTLCTCRSYKGHKEVKPGCSFELENEIAKQVIRLFPRCTEHKNKMCPSDSPVYRIRSSAPYLFMCPHSQQEFQVSCREVVQYCLPPGLTQLLFQGHPSYDKLEGRVLAVGEHATDEKSAELSLLAILRQATPHHVSGKNTAPDGEVIEFDKTITAHDIPLWEIRCSGCSLFRPDKELKDLHETSVRCKFCPELYPNRDAFYHHHKAKHHDSVFDGLEGYPHSCSMCEKDSSA
ncbi:hypothetical protein BDV97DRAFT_414475 [Delphinella strobiligena]|nr:hypothetical protein BDV97DRAFT_414475 [Delphinella strobiligena]